MSWPTGRSELQLRRGSRDATAAEATYGHISTWDTSGVTDMSELFCGDGSVDMEGKLTRPMCGKDGSFNEDIGAWDTSGVTRMRRDVRMGDLQPGHRWLGGSQRR